MVKVIHAKNDCIGCGACTAICPDYWEMDGDKSKLKGAKKDGDRFVLELKDAGCCKDAADSCPVPCIFVEK